MSAGPSGPAIGRPVQLCALRGCTRPAHFDFQSGIVHDYCGRSHAEQALRAGGRSLPPPHGICHVCKLPGCGEPVAFENGRVHEYCCRGHADEALAMGLAPRSNRQLQGRGAPDHRCSLPGCSAPRFVDHDTGFEHDFCGRTHARQASAQGLAPHNAAVPGTPARAVDRVWRGRPGEPYVLSVLTNEHPRYESVKQQFREGWQHPGPVPTVVRILQVRNPEAVYSRYTAHAEALRRASGDANEVRRFHGTGSRCSFGIDVTQPPCTDPACAVCTICASSFDLRLAGSAVRPGAPFAGFRYGRGLYFSRVSSKSNDYAAGSERVNPHSLVAGRYRLMFLCKVATGVVEHVLEERLEESCVDAIASARGHGGRSNSIVGLDSKSGGKLNYEETVVYQNEAAIPSYLIVYRVQA